MAESAEFVHQITRSQRQLHAFILSMVWSPTEADDGANSHNILEFCARVPARRPELGPASPS